MVKKIKTCVFISGSGTNLRCLIKNSRDYNSPIKINLIISNNKNANGLKFARKYNIPYKIFVNKFNDKYQTTLLKEQKELLTHYIASFADNGMGLKIFLNSEITLIVIAIFAR